MANILRRTPPPALPPEVWAGVSDALDPSFMLPAIVLARYRRGTPPDQPGKRGDPDFISDELARARQALRTPDAVRSLGSLVTVTEPVGNAPTKNPKTEDVTTPEHAAYAYATQFHGGAVALRNICVAAEQIGRGLSAVAALATLSSFSPNSIYEDRDGVAARLLQRGYEVPDSVAEAQPAPPLGEDLYVGQVIVKIVQVFTDMPAYQMYRP